MDSVTIAQNIPYGKFSPTGIRFGCHSVWRHSWRDWGLYCLSLDVGAPEVERFSLTIPGRMGNLDLSEVLTGAPVYKNRTIKATFRFLSGGAAWLDRYSAILNFLHGQEIQMIPDVDEDYYYAGRCTVDSVRENICYSDFTITLDAFPYKREVVGVLDDWLWDPLNFNDGIIREYGSLRIPAGEMPSFRIIGSEMPVSADVTISAEQQSSFTIEANYKHSAEPEIQLSLPDGFTPSAFRLGNGENLLTITKAMDFPVTVKINFQVGRL